MIKMYGNTGKIYPVSKSESRNNKTGLSSIVSNLNPLAAAQQCVVEIRILMQILINQLIIERAKNTYY